MIDASIQQAALISLAAMLQRINLALLKRARQRMTIEFCMFSMQGVPKLSALRVCALLAPLISSFLIRDMPGRADDTSA